jgi:hypothetical protein
MKETDLYDTEDGFKSALTGVYISMASSSLYGQRMTMEMPELLAQHWDVVYATTSDAYLRDYDFESDGVKSMVSEVWKSYYNAIVGLNSLLNAIDAKKGLFTNGNYEMLKGEALGLRAFLHFDILRFWGPVPTNANAAEITIPYMVEVTKELNKLKSISYGEALAKIIADLDAAEELLKHDDPILTYPNAILNNVGVTSGPYDEFHYFRQNRFNYYAVKATKARCYQWINDKGRALAYAQEVIDAVSSQTNAKVFQLATEETVGGNANLAADLLMTVEHIFAVHNPQLSKIVEPFFNFGNCYRDIQAIEDAYEYAKNSNDIRCKAGRYWEDRLVIRRQNLFKKYYNPDTQVSQTVVPLIRLSEMYFIAMECGSLQEANAKFIDFRIARMMDVGLDNSLRSRDDVDARLELEYRKDFYGEGQMFYFYKQHNRQTISWPRVVNNVKYKIPKPEEQTNFE